MLFYQNDISQEMTDRKISRFIDAMMSRASIGGDGNSC